MLIESQAFLCCFQACKSVTYKEIFPSTNSYPCCSFKAFSEPFRQNTLLHLNFLTFKWGSIANIMLYFFWLQSWSVFQACHLGFGPVLGGDTSVLLLHCALRPPTQPCLHPQDFYKKPQQLVTGQLRKTLWVLLSFLQLLLTQSFRFSGNTIISWLFFSFPV